MTSRIPRSIHLGYCNNYGLGVTDKLYTLEEALRMVKVLNQRAMADAERGISPNTVYWVHENNTSKERTLGA